MLDTKWSVVNTESVLPFVMPTPLTRCLPVDLMRVASLLCR